MAFETLEEELSGYSSEVLQEIRDTQQDLYSSEELAHIEVLISRCKESEEKERQAFEREVERNLPAEIDCQKCGGPNRMSDEVCKFCGAKLEKSAIYAEVRARLSGEVDDVLDGEGELGVSRQDGKSYTFHYVISALIPLVGFIMGAILLTKDDEEDRSAGKLCIAAGLVAMVLSALLWNAYVNSIMY